MKKPRVDPQQIPNSLLVAFSVSTLLICLAYPFYAAYLAPNYGIEFGAEWTVQGILDCEPGDSACTANRAQIQVGDQLITIGNLNHADFLHGRFKALFDGYNPGDSVPISFRRDGEERNIEWILPGLTATESLNRLTEILICLPFWLSGTVVMFLLRPQDMRWRLLILFNYATAVYLTLGMVSYFVPYSYQLSHVLAWLISPLYLHFHLVIPSPLLSGRKRHIISILYGTAIGLVLLDLFQILPIQSFSIGLVLAIVGSLGLLAYRLLTPISPSDRLALRLMFIGIGLAFSPGLILIVVPFLFQLVFPQLPAVAISFIAIPLLPLFYMYAIYRRHLGGFEVRANRLLSLYSFVLLYSLGILLVFGLTSASLRLSDQSLVFSLVVTLIFVVAAPPLRSRYQRWFEKQAYGAQHDPQEIVRIFALRLPSALEPTVLTHLLTREVMPSLLIRESALYMAVEGGYSLFYADGITLSERVAKAHELKELLDTAGQYRPQDTTPQGVFQWVRLAITLPVGSKTTGVWLVGRRDPDDFYPSADILLLKTLASQLAPMLETIRLYAETHHRLERLQSLQDIDIAISASLDMRFTLDVLLEQITRQPNVDAADLLLYNPKTMMLEYVAGRGFHSDALHHTRLRLGEGHAGKAAQVRQLIFIPDLDEKAGSLARSPLLPAENFKSYCAAPLLAKGQMKGVLEVFYRTPVTPDPEWFRFLESLTVQAAIAIDNASLFDDLQRSNAELIMAYDTTIEGWSHALDLRDEGTKGHTQRVTEMTERLARSMGMRETDLIHVRRGALLHDMGKMGIPDNILLKKGKLTEEEWGIMRKHPVYAYEMLANIAYLRPALDIPYCHHEKWDGTGYPRGLKGEAIPLAARIFAVVDVWDATTSDRPYRNAWSTEKTRAYLTEQSGMHFDPQVIQVFLASLHEGYFYSLQGPTGV